MTAVVIARMHIQYVVLLTSPKEQMLLEHFEKVRAQVVCVPEKSPTCAFVVMSATNENTFSQQAGFFVLIGVRRYGLMLLEDR